MKVYLDDMRDAPEGWVRTCTPSETIDLLKTGKVTMLSLDHDLGIDDDTTGYTVLLWIEEQMYTDESFLPPRIIRIHTDNAGARLKMEMAVTKIYELNLNIKI